MDKEKWITEALESINGIKRAEPNPFLFSKIMNRINSGAVSGYFTFHKAAIGLVSLILLTALNVAAFLSLETEQLSSGSKTECIPSQQNTYLEFLKE